MARIAPEQSQFCQMGKALRKCGATCPRGRKQRRLPARHTFVQQSKDVQRPCPRCYLDKEIYVHKV